MLSCLLFPTVIEEAFVVLTAKTRKQPGDIVKPQIESFGPEHPVLVLFAHYHSDLWEG